MSRFLIAAGLILALAQTVSAQQPASDTTKEVITNATSTSYDTRTTRKSWDGIIYTDVFAIFGQANLASMFRVGDHFGVGGGLHVPTPLIKESGLGLTGEARWYPGKHALSGFYIAPNITYNLYKINNSSSNAYSAGMLVAYEWIFRDNIALGLAGGADYFSFDRSASYILLERSGITPAFRLDFGLAW